MENRGQVNAIIYFGIVVLILLFAAPILMKVVVAPVSKIGTSFATVDPTNKSTEAISYVQNKFTSVFDWVIAVLFMFNIVLLLITAFLVDTHPAFLVVYIFAAMFLVIFSPVVLDVLENMYNSASFSSGDENIVQYLPITEFLYQNYGYIIVGVIILSGVIMFGKYRLGANSGGRFY